MTPMLRKTLNALLKPDALAKIEQRAVTGPLFRGAVNTHIHLPPNFCAFNTVSQAVDLAARQNVQVVGFSNYYDFFAYGEFTRLAVPHGIFPLFGIEIIGLIPDLVRAGVKINDPGNPGKIYICGKGITHFGELSAEAGRLLGIIRQNDRIRMASLIARLADIFASHGLQTGLTADQVKDKIVSRHGCPRETVHLQERHVAMAFQEAIFTLVPPSDRLRRLGELFGVPSKADPGDAVKVQDEIRSHLMKAGKAAYIEETFQSLEEARRLILELGGIPCYPVLADGVTPICGFEAPVEKLVAQLHSSGIHSVELIPSRNTPEVLTQYVIGLRSAGIVVTAGTEHNTLDLLPIAPACKGGIPIPDDIQSIFREGACVVAAHQLLSFHGRTGYVDSEGNLNNAYPDQKSRIAALHKLGAAAIAYWKDACVQGDNRHE